MADGHPHPATPNLEALCAWYLKDETHAVEALIRQTRLDASARARIVGRAGALVTRLRRSGDGFRAHGRLAPAI